MTKSIKQMLTIILITLTLIIAFVGMLTMKDSLAWFSRNEKVTAEGLTINATVSPNLVIGKSVEDLTNQGMTFSVDFNGAARTDMIAVTHDNAFEGTYLKYLTSLYAVGVDTGVAKDGATLEFAPVPTADNESYFIDYTVYIASVIEPIEVSSLTAQIVIPTAVNNSHPYFFAASIDFYIDEVNLENYLGTTSVSDSINGTERAKIDILPGGGTVPVNTAEPMKIIMRCYFDGALRDPDTNYAYINSYTADTDGVVMGVSFIATDSIAE